MATADIRYFLGANSPDGFYSLYDQMIDPVQARRIYILKGGPGCGKSTLMRRVAARAEELGQETEYIHCSGDPDSLDAVVLPGLGVAVADGTAPHVIEPRYPGVVEQYVDLGTCYRREGLDDVRGAIIRVTGAYKAGYGSAYRCLAAAGKVQEELRSMLTTPEMEGRLQRRAGGILSREVHRRRGAAPGRATKRFLGAVTHRGRMRFYGTAEAQCSRIYELSDRYGLAHSLLLPLLEGTVQAGYDVVACPDPMAPERLAHLIVPELGLGFISTTPALPFKGKPYRRIRVEGAVEPQLLREGRARVRFAKKTADALTDEGILYLARTKARHDEMEDLYHPYIDFDRVRQVADGIVEEIFGG